MTQVICSHGFGVDATGRGLFTDIAEALPWCEFTMFDYNDFDEADNMTVPSLMDQVTTLNEHIYELEDEVILLCHSLGCVIGALSDLTNVTKIVFLAPPDDLNLQKFVGIFGQRDGTVFNPAGVSSIPRGDGTTMYIGKDFLESIMAVDVKQALYAAAEARPSVLIRAEQDELVGQTSFDGINAEVMTLSGTHNFTGEARKQLIATLQELLH